MGLLRAGLPWWMQTGQPEPAQSMTQPAGIPAPAAGVPAPQAYQPRPQQMQAPQGITQYGHQPLQGGQMPQLGAVPERQRMSFGDQLQETFEAPLFQQGLAFMAAGARGGGGWGEAADRMSQISQQQQQRRMQERQMRREDAADKREETQFGWQGEERARQMQERAALDAWIETQPEADRAALRANPEVAYQAYMEARAAANMPITPFQQAQLDMQRRGLGIDWLNAQANIARANMNRPLRGPDASLMSDVREQAARSRMLATMGDEFLVSNARNATGELSPWNPLNLVSPDRDNMRSIESRMRGYMRPPGSGATSDFEQRLYGLGTPSTTRVGPSNQMIVDGYRALASIDQARSNFFEMYASENGNLYGAEAAFQASPEFRRLESDFNGRWGASQQREAPAQQQQSRSFETLPPASQFSEGQRITDTQTGRRFIIRDGRWVPERNVGQDSRRLSGGLR